MNSVSLYSFASEEIKVSVDAYFEEEILVIDGYDKGKRVKEYWGDSDYEYVTKIPSAGVDQLYTYFNLNKGEKAELLKTLAARYNTNTCYSDIRKLLEELGIQHEAFSWT